MITILQTYAVVGFLVYVYFFTKGMIHPTAYISMLIKCLLIGPFMMFKYWTEENALNNRLELKQQEKEARKRQQVPESQEKEEDEE